MKYVVIPLNIDIEISKLPFSADVLLMSLYQDFIEIFLRYNYESNSIVPSKFCSTPDGYSVFDTYKFQDDRVSIQVSINIKVYSNSSLELRDARFIDRRLLSFEDIDNYCEDNMLEVKIYLNRNNKSYYIETFREFETIMDNNISNITDKYLNKDYE